MSPRLESKLSGLTHDRPQSFRIFAIVRAGSFVLDLRVDATMSTSSAFGLLGVGVNVN